MAAWVIPAIAAGVQILGSLFGGSQASKAMRSARRDIEQRNDENEDLYNRRYNEDATQRADAQRVLTLTEDAVRKRNRAAAGAQAVMGGNEASVAAQREMNNQATADAASRIAAAGEARKDKIEENYLARKQQLQDQLTNMKVGQAQNTAQAIQGVSSAVGGALMNMGSSKSSGDIWSRGGETRIPAGARVGLSNIDAAKDTVSFGSYVDQLAKQNGWGQ